MSIYSTSVKKPITTLMVFVGIMVFGIYSYFQLPVDFYPKMDPPFITVFTSYPGASAADVEQNITRKLEDGFGSLSNLKKMTSNSKENLSVIMLEYDWGANLDESVNEVRNAVGLAERNLPEEVESPTILKISTSMIPVLMYSITSDESYEAIMKIIDNQFVQPLNRIDGVGSVYQTGAPARAILVDVDPRKLDSYNLTIEQIGGVLSANNINLPSGSIEMGKSDFPLRLQGEFTNSDIIKNLVVSNTNGKTIYLKDVANVRDTLKLIKSDERANGRKSVRLLVQKQSDANSVQVAKDVRAKVEEIKKNLPPDVKVDVLFDTSTYTVNSINNLKETVIYALVFVILVVLLFLGRWRATFIVALSIPVSLIAGFIYMYLSGGTINIITLSSISIAIGLVVDDSIVVLENITKKLESRGFAREAAIYGTSEVSLAVIASTLTIIVVFLPLTMLGGMTGILFKPLGFIVTITITTSVFVAMTLTPMLSAKLLSAKEPEKDSFSGKIYFFSQNMFNKLDNFYEGVLEWAVSNRWKVVSIATAIFGASLLLLFFIGTEFMPASDNGRINAQVKLVQGVKIEETSLLADKLDSIFMKKYPEIEIISASAGSGDEGSMTAIFSQTGNYIITYTFRMKDRADRKRDIFQVSDLMREDIAQFPQVESFYVDAGGSRSNSVMGGGGGNNIEVQVFGHDFDKTNLVAEQISNALKGIYGAKDITISRDKEKAELSLVLDNEKLTYFGLTTASVATAIRNRINGLTATKYKEEGDEYDVIVRYDEKFRQSTEDVMNISIMTPSGKFIKLHEIASLKEQFSTPNIDRENKERYVTITAGISDSDLGTIKAELQTKVAKMNIPEGVTVVYGGSAEDMQESFTNLIYLMLLSILLVYIVMAAQFESLSEPFIIMFSIPFAFTGVFIGLFIFGSTINVISLIGVVMLIGIVVKNGILLVDFTNLLRDRGFSLKQAVVKAGRSRLRPVLMTSLTVILAMIPMIFGAGEGSEMWRPMAIAIFSGLTFSTLVTLILIPAIYTMFGVGRMKREKKEQIEL